MNIERLLFYDNIRNDEIVRMAASLYSRIESLLCQAEDKGDLIGAEAENSSCAVKEMIAENNSIAMQEMINDYYHIQRLLLKKCIDCETSGTFWQSYIYKLTAESENAFSLSAEKASLNEMNENIMMLAEGDISEIRELINYDWNLVRKMLDPQRACVCLLDSGIIEGGRGRELREALGFAKKEEAFTDAEAAKRLVNYYSRHLCGILGKYKAFVWDSQDGLTGVREHDKITFDDLIGYDIQQQQLIRNTEMFVNGFEANNVLLYGDKGTGKSSSVKALLNHFEDKNLRMISVPKSEILSITKVMEKVANRGCYVILFIDDLSFENTEIEYKHFKSVLEGGVEVQPSNVLVYVTSNRRNLVKETWADRNKQSGEIFEQDGIQERQSLADRFGLTITFYAPDKQLYIDMVKMLAKKEGIELSDDILLAEASKWDMRQTSRSGRSVKQFITHMKGILRANN